MATLLSRRAPVVGACLAAVALLAGCGGSGDLADLTTAAGKSPLALAQEAPDRTRDAGTSRFAVDAQMSISGEALSMTGEGVYDYAGQIGEVDYSMSASAGLPAQSLEVIMENNVLYQREVGQQRWQKVDYSDLVETPIGQYDPAQQLDLLRGVSDEVREVGTEQLRGADVRHLAITIDPVKLAAESGVVVEGGLTQSALQAAGPIPGDVFVDDDGRVRRLQIRMVVEGAKIADIPELAEFAQDPRFAEMMENRRSEMSISIDYFDFGAPVDAEVPDPSTVDVGGNPLGLPG